MRKKRMQCKRQTTKGNNKGIIKMVKRSTAINQHETTTTEIGITTEETRSNTSRNEETIVGKRKIKKLNKPRQ